MPTYHEILTTDLSTLTTAADRWDGMAAKLKTQETNYQRDVHGITLGVAWLGRSQEAANARFGIRLKEFQDAQTEAKAIASLLRDAHGQFTELRGKLESARDDAIAKGLTVTDQGEVFHDTAKLSEQDRLAYAHDPDEKKAVSASIASFQARIDHCVQAVNNADGGVEVALGAVTRGPATNDGLGPEFNGKAQGDIETYEEDEAEDIADRVRSGDATPADYRELRRLLADNSHDKKFSQTLLDHLGAKGTLELSNTLDGLAHHGDPKHGSEYLDIQKGLATTLATATQGPHSAFYKDFRAQMRKVGTEQFTVDGLGLPGEKIRGYQSLVTLMQQGKGYDGWFLEDMADDIRHAEETYTPDYGKPDSPWAMDEKFAGKNGGWFANDPLDGVLGIMSHDPTTSADYLDPAHGNDTLDYLLHDRDWNVMVDHYATPPGGYSQGFPVMDVDGDDRKGFGDALTAAATGIDPNGPRPLSPTAHTDANNRIFLHTLTGLSRQGDDMPASLRDDMAKIMINHGHETYVTMSDPSGNTRHPTGGLTLDQKQVFEMTKQISRSKDSYDILHEGMNYAIMDDIHDHSRRPEDTLNSAGNAIGFMEQGRYIALREGLRDHSWDRLMAYHVVGAPLTVIPVTGDVLQRSVDVATSAWLLDEQHKDTYQLTADNQDAFRDSQNQLNAVANQWYDANPQWAETHTGFSHSQGIFQTIDTAAGNGNRQANGLAGEH